jgi:GntR family transcriptional regulator, transcriptional repressor for pyruvate dehydrogenase complex
LDLRSPTTDASRFPALNVRRIERASAPDAVREQILELIHSGQLEVGAKLPSEQELARSFGVSRPVVREGLGQLRSIGVIESRSGSGSFVKSARIAPQGLLLAGGYSSDELHEIRSEIEVPGAALAAARRTEEQLSLLTEIVERHRHQPDAKDWVADDLAFHVTLAEASRNSLRVRFVTELRELQSELSLTMARIKGGLGAPVEEHAAIVEAVRRRDEDGAAAAMLAHLEGIRSRLIPHPAKRGEGEAHASKP